MKKSDQKLSLRKDQRGLSTMEYAVLFVVIVVGALVAWGKLGGELSKQVNEGYGKFKTTVSVSKVTGTK